MWGDSMDSIIDELPVVLSVEDVAKLLAIGRNSAYALVHSGALKYVRIGRQIRVPKSALMDYLGIQMP